MSDGHDDDNDDDSDDVVDVNAGLYTEGPFIVRCSSVRYAFFHEPHGRSIERVSQYWTERRSINMHKGGT